MKLGKTILAILEHELKKAEVLLKQAELNEAEAERELRGETPELDSLDNLKYRRRETLYQRGQRDALNFVTYLARINAKVYDELEAKV